MEARRFLEVFKGSVYMLRGKQTTFNPDYLMRPELIEAKPLPLSCFKTYSLAIPILLRGWDDRREQGKQQMKPTRLIPFEKILKNLVFDGTLSEVVGML